MLQFFSFGNFLVKHMQFLYNVFTYFTSRTLSSAPWTLASVPFVIKNFQLSMITPTPEKIHQFNIEILVS